MEELLCSSAGVVEEITVVDGSVGFGDVVGGGNVVSGSILVSSGMEMLAACASAMGMKLCSKLPLNM